MSVTTRLVQVSVLVHDKDGHAAPDLTRDDFQIFDNGAPQRISLFSVGRSEADRIAPPQRKSPPLSISNRSAAQNEEPVVATVILFDELHCGDVTEWTRARLELMKFLAAMRSGDPVALYILRYAGLVVVQDFTDDAKALASVAQRHLAPTVLKASDLADERNPAFLVELTVKALEAIAQHVAGIPGRKNLVWISSSIPAALEVNAAAMAALQPPAPAFPSGPRQPEAFWRMPRDYTQNFHNLLERLSQRLNDSNVALYPIDPRGLLTDGPEAASTHDKPEAGFTSATTSNAPQWASMDMLAQETGGRAFYHANDVAGSIRLAMEDARITYLLGFYPDSEPDGKYHKLEVKVLRPGVRVRARRGYFATVSHVDAEAKRDGALHTAAASPLEGSAIGVTLNVESNPLGWWFQDVVVRVDPQDVRFEQKDGRWRAAIDVVLAGLRRDGRILGGMRNAVQYTLFYDTYQEALEHGLYFQRTLYVHPGVARVRAIVRDATTGAVGSVSVPVRQ